MWILVGSFNSSVLHGHLKFEPQYMDFETQKTGTCVKLRRINVIIWHKWNELSAALANSWNQMKENNNFKVMLSNFR